MKQAPISTRETALPKQQNEMSWNIDLLVSRDRDDMRLDRFITTVLKEKYASKKDLDIQTIPSHSLLEKLARKRKILVNGKPVKKLGERVRTKDKITIPRSCVQLQQTEATPNQANVPKVKITLPLTQDQINEVRSW